MRSEQPIIDFMYEMAKKAKQLGNMKIKELRSAAGYNCNTDNEAQRMNAYKDRGELIEEILIEEFEMEAETLEHSLQK